MELKDSDRVVSTIEARLDSAIKAKYPMAAKMVPSEIKDIIRDALTGAYASGFNHGALAAKEAINGTAK